jgi:hypothetical protein
MEKTMPNPTSDAKKIKKIPSKNKKKAEKDRMKGWKEFLKDDADFDYEFILRVLKYKLERTRKCIASNDIVLDAKRVVKEIKEVEELICKVLKDNYFHEMTKDFRKEYGSLQWKTVKHKDDEGKFDEMRFYFTKETPETRDSIFSKWHAFSKKAEEARKADLKKAFELMSERIWSWWD